MKAKSLLVGVLPGVLLAIYVYYLGKEIHALIEFLWLACLGHVVDINVLSQFEDVDLHNQCEWQ